MHKFGQNAEKSSRQWAEPGCENRFRDERIYQAVKREIALTYLRRVCFSWHSLSEFLPRDVARYQLLTGTCRQPKHIRTA